MGNPNDVVPTFKQDLINNLFWLLLFMAAVIGFGLGMISSGNITDAIWTFSIAGIVLVVSFIAQWFSYKKTYRPNGRSKYHS